MSSDEFLNLTPEEILEESRIGKPLIIVEGEYDYIYEYLSDSIKDNHYVITPVRDLIGKEGNLALEELLLDIESFANNEELEYVSHILGIIDRDYREYEDRLTQSEILFILEFYSIESYFINVEILYKCLYFSIRSKRLMCNSFVEPIYQNIMNELVNFFYQGSIEKLRKHLEVDEVIDMFQLNESFETLLKLTKGKDLLTRFLVEIQEILSSKKLYKLCRDKKVALCPKYHDNEHEKFCLYATQKYDVPQLRKYVFEQIDIASLTPIKERLKQLK